MNIEARILSSMEKVFPMQAPSALAVPMTCLQGENYAFQVAIRPDSTFTRGISISVSVESDLDVTLTQVGYVPARLLYVTNQDTALDGMLAVLMQTDKFLTYTVRDSPMVYDQNGV